MTTFDHNKALEQKLAAMPVRKWQCSDGCVHLREVYRVDDKQRWRCAYWDTAPVPIAAARPSLERCVDLNEKRILGPHTDEPVRECPHYKARADA